MLIPAFLAGSFLLSSGPGFNVVMRANQEGRLDVFPKVLTYQFLFQLALAGIVFGITRAVT